MPASAATTLTSLKLEKENSLQHGAVFTSQFPFRLPRRFPLVKIFIGFMLLPAWVNSLAQTFSFFKLTGELSLKTMFCAFVHKPVSSTSQGLQSTVFPLHFILYETSLLAQAHSSPDSLVEMLIRAPALKISVPNV